MPSISHRRRLATGLAALLGIATPAAAQTADSARVQSYHRARAVLMAAEHALGELRGGVEIVEEDSAANPTQGYRVADPTRFPTRTRTLLDVAGRRMRRDADFWYPGGYHFQTVTVVRPDSGFAFDPARSRDGTDLAILTPARMATLSSAAARILLNTIVAQALANATTLRFVGSGLIDGRTQQLVAYSDNGGAEFTLHFDASTNQLTRLERLLPGSPEPLHYTVDYLGYRGESGIRTPVRTEIRINGVLSQQQHFANIVPNAPVTDSLFRVPAGFTPPPPTGPPTVRPMGNGVYLLDAMPGDYRSMFADLGDEVVVLEAPVSADYSRQAIALIERTLPGKPIRTVLVSHHHGDHIAGAPVYASRGGVTFVAGAGAEGALAALAGPAPGSVQVRTVLAHTTIGTGDRRIEIHPVPNSHAESMLLFYFPALRLLFQGDLLTVPHRGPLPPSIAVTRELGAAIDALGLQVDSIVGVHGRTATSADLRAVALKTAP